MLYTLRRPWTASFIFQIQDSIAKTLKTFINFNNKGENMSNIKVKNPKAPVTFNQAKYIGDLMYARVSDTEKSRLAEIYQEAFKRGKDTKSNTYVAQGRSVIWGYAAYTYAVDCGTASDLIGKLKADDKFKIKVSVAVMKEAAKASFLKYNPEATS